MPSKIVINKVAVVKMQKSNFGEFCECPQDGGMNIMDISVAVLRLTKLNLFSISGDVPRTIFLIYGDVPRTLF